ncbi:MAG: TAXI family TRAP transporter solute-binding subunit [Desulforhopalus sp.]|nr:TAXI family TRAP transporter solute-binding subunit [Desulforhopalus sp.]
MPCKNKEHRSVSALLFALRPYHLRQKLGVVGTGAGRFFAVALMAVCILVFLAVNPVPAIKPFRIGTGGTTGVYYPIGKLIAAGLTASAARDSSALAGYIGVAQNSAGSVENVRTVVSGELEAGLVQADTAGLAYNGQGEFAGLPKAADLRAIAALYPEKFQLVIRKDAGISSIGDLRGKRISVDELGSGTRGVTNIVLNAYGLSEKDLVPLYIKPSFTEERMMNGQMDGFAFVGGIPNAAVTKLFDIGVNLLPVDLPIATAINEKHPFLVPGKISGNIYPGIPETPTLEVRALLVVSRNMAEAVAYAVTEALFSEATRKLLTGGHPLGKDITVEAAQQGLSIPLHPGALRFYREHSGESR